jgi:putative oxidoreductase
MPVEFEEVPSTKVDKVGRSGIPPLSGPVPSGNLPARLQTDRARHEQLTAVTRTASALEPWMLGLGRAIFGGFFVYNGINHFRNAQMLTEYARAKNVPLPGAAVAVTGGMLVLGGLSLIAGTRPKLGASLISAFLAGVSPQIHNFWRIDDPQQKMQEMTNFSKNMALLGAACIAAAVPEPWPVSLPVGRG